MRLSEGLGIRAVVIANVTKARQKYGPQSSQKFDLLVTTPNRLVHLLKESDEGPPLSLANVEWLVVDESDRLFEDGQRGFRDQLAAVYQACTGTSVTQALFSATFAQSVQDWCRLNLHNMAMVSVGLRNSASEDVEQHLQFCGNEGGKLHALRDILRKGYEPPVLLFVQTKERAKELFRELIYDNITVDTIHADRTQKQSSGQQVPQWMLDLKKPTKNEKRRMTMQQPERGHVSRAVQHEKVAKRRKKQMLEKHKKMKIESSEAA
ncbi:putative ATP-dependent RNA helicase DDX52 [Portunus trituberculatus]|uniref:ATP-dependent RNA helicase n=1 Tax=Portunus trituberculatus TaxID=210409 RepID=A0A5B7F044_PORTR|nr:putative ATP-dependent RNA helicase DDX52 [Portunus trituberculatus]